MREVYDACVCNERITASSYSRRDHLIVGQIDDLFFFLRQRDSDYRPRYEKYRIVH